MASLPAPPSSQRRATQTQAPLTPSSTTQDSSRLHSHDSQTIFTQQQDDQEESQEQSQLGQTQPAQTAGETDLDKKCWICFSDASEDTPETSPWRDPCPCALVAHEECLLDWIADMEAPKNNRNRSVTAPRIECPQCKSEIKLARPTNYIVDAVRSFERFGAKVVTPGAIATLCGVVYSSSMAWGAHSIYAVFGAEDGFRILRPIIYNTVRAPVEVYLDSPRNASKQILGLIVDRLVHWRLFVGLPLITPILILSRTTFADGVLPVLPIVFFASQTPPNGVIDFGQWPPSASFVFALLPYFRSIYNTYYERVWAKREKKWLQEIQPRAGQSQSDANDNADDGNGGNAAANEEDEDDDDDNVFEVRIDGGMWQEWNDEAAGAQQQPANQPAAPIVPQPQPQNDNGDDNNNAGPLPPAAEEGAQNPANPPAQAQGILAAAQAAEAAAAAAPPQQPQLQPQPAERRLSFSPTAIAESILGALIFPTIAGLTGEALKLLLPASWTAAASVSASGRFNGRPVPRGLLQQKWGRSVVGGCLFVVCKDALMLYVRWKMAQMHRRRRVVDYERRERGRR